MLSRHARPERCRRTTSETNPKSEYRNPKQTQSQINLKSGKSKTPNPKGVWNFTYFGHLILFRISDFVLRIFLFLAPLRLCARHSFSGLLFIPKFQISLGRL